MSAPGGLELPDDLAVVELRAGHVEGGRQVDDEAVDLLVLERRDRRVVGVVDARSFVGLMTSLIVVVARRPDLGAELMYASAIGDL